MFVVKWYTRASRVRIVIAKFDGRWKLPGGPYPIPEAIALVGGILLTLLALPRFGAPLMTGVLGIAATATTVAVMRKMPYSPVPFATRAHRVLRLYTSPVSVSTDDDAYAANAVTIVRPHVEMLDAIPDIAVRQPHSRRAATVAPPADDGWAEMFSGHQRSAAADLFT